MNPLSFDLSRRRRLLSLDADLRLAENRRDMLRALHPEEFPEDVLREVMELDQDVERIEMEIREVEGTSYREWQKEERYAYQEAQWRERTGR